MLICTDSWSHDVILLAVVFYLDHDRSKRVRLLLRVLVVVGVGQSRLGVVMTRRLHSR